MRTQDAPRIKEIPDLQAHLQAAIELELATIPIYLCGSWTIARDVGRCASDIMDVAVSEMYHMTITCNCLIATGVWPRILSAAPKYPSYLPDGEHEFEVGLYPFGGDFLKQALKIESPSGTDLPARIRELIAERKPIPRRHPHRILGMGNTYPTIGDFYNAIKTSIMWLVHEHGEAAVFPWRDDETKQVAQVRGRDLLVTGGVRALELLGDIIEEGEGNNKTIVDEKDDLAHYFTFDQMHRRRRYRKGDQPHDPQGDPLQIPTDVYPMKPNPKKEDYAPGSQAAKDNDAFNDAYRGLLSALQSTFNGSPGDMEDVIGNMSLLTNSASKLFGDSLPDGYVAGPTFEP
jgi:hypothetical protein